MSDILKISCTSCNKVLKVPVSMIGKSGNCPVCKTKISIKAPTTSAATPSTREPKAKAPVPVAKATERTVSQQVPVAPKKAPSPQPAPRTLVATDPQFQRDVVTSHREEFNKDRERFAAAMSVAPDKFPIVQPYLMDHESVRALALQRPFPFTLFSDIVVLTSHRLLVFKRFFTKVSMVDVNYIDFGDMTISQGFFSSSIYMRSVDGKTVSVPLLITQQALQLYRHCQDIETKARNARRQFQLEENRSRTNQLQINNIAPSASPDPFSRTVDSLGVSTRDIAKVGDEVRDPYRLGE